MCKIKDLTGNKYGKLTVLFRVANKGNKAHWECRCECGNIIQVAGTNLKSGNTKSCGCSQEHHGMRKTKLYGVWAAMKNRCANPNVREYKWYGARGIVVCDEWRTSFINFSTWALDNGYKDGLTLDRIDCNDDYKPENCRWSTAKVQSNNRRNVIKVEIDGEVHTLREWSEISGLSYAAVKSRYYHGKRGKTLIKND